MIRSSQKYWLFLAGAVLFEVAGTAVMKLSRDGMWIISSQGGLVLMFMLIGLSYYCLSLAIQGLPVGVAYAFWEGLGLTLITLISVLALDEPLTLRHGVALAAVLIGAGLIRHGTVMVMPDAPASAPVRAASAPVRAASAVESRARQNLAGAKVSLLGAKSAKPPVLYGEGAEAEAWS